MATFIIPGLFRKKSFYKPLADRLQKAGFETQIIDLGLNFRNLKITSKIVEDSLKKTSERDDVIAHSFGGIVLKYLIFKNPKIVRQFKSITFVSVPHGGSWQALFLSMVPAAREVLPFRTTLKKLSTVSLPESTVNFISEKELKIWPRKNALLSGYIDIVIPDTNHDSIIKSEAFASKAIKFIESDFSRFFYYESKD